MSLPRVLTDQHGRTIRKLRVSLTDKCNLRCHYCMPVDATFMEEGRFLSPAEYEEFVAELVGYGLEELRLTGGEPLVRSSFPEIADRLGALPLKKIGLTTNGVLLKRALPVLKRNRILHLNVSLDSLDAENFRKITNGNRLPLVLDGIESAVREGFHVKINVVAMRGVNDHEFPDFVELGKRLGVEVRFLELMRIGFALKEQANQFISAAEIMRSLQPRYSFRPQSREKDSTSVNYVTACGAEVGFIASESQAFCGQCSRWRLSADGVLRACLLKDDGLSVRHTSPEQRADIYARVLGMKPFLRPKEVMHQMNAIGG